MKWLNAEQTRKLSSYSAAAALGAFSAQQACGEIIYTDLEPDEIAEDGATPDINLNNTGYFEVSIITTSGGSANMQIRAAYESSTGSIILTSAGSYYVQGFDAGELIDSNSNIASGGVNVAANNNYNFFSGDQKYIGVSFEIAGETHYGWIGFEIDSTSPLHGIVRDYAYESVPDTGIVAGEIPEPNTLALLAAGAGALACGRRRQKA